MFADRLKKSLLQAAIQGKLTEQLPTDGDARDLLRKIRTDKVKLVATKKIKAEKPLSPVTEEEIPFDLPDNWCWVRLGDVCQINPRNKLEDENIDATFLPMTAINDGYSNGYSPLVKSWNKIRNGFTHFADGDVIFAKITPCFQNRKSAVVEGLTNGIGAGTTELYVLRSYGKYINEKYLLYFVKNQQFILDGIATMKGTAGQQRISRNFVVNYLLPLPPLAEQKRIVEKLDALLSEVDELAKDERELVELEENFPRRMKKSLLQAAIQGKLTEQLPSDGDARDLLKKIRTEKVKLVATKKIKAEKPLPSITDDEIPFDLPDNWCWCRLGDVALKIHYGFTTSASNQGNVKLLRITDIQNDEVCWEHVPRCTVTDSQKRDYLLKNGDLVIARTGGTVGKTFVVENLQDEAVFASYLIRVMLNENISSKYIKFFTGSPLYWRQIIDKSQGTGQPNVNGKSLSNLILPLPPLAEQERVVERLEELLPLCEI